MTFLLRLSLAAIEALAILFALAAGQVLNTIDLLDTHSWDD